MLQERLQYIMPDSPFDLQDDENIHIAVAQQLFALKDDTVLGQQLVRLLNDMLCQIHNDAQLVSTVKTNYRYNLHTICYKASTKYTKV